MTADEPLPDRPRGVEWLELGTLLSLSLAAVTASWIWGYAAGAGGRGGSAAAVSSAAPDIFSYGAVAEPVALPTATIAVFWMVMLLAIVFPLAEIVAKRIAGSAGDGASAQAEADDKAHSGDLTND